MRERRWPYDLMQVMRFGRCPKCHAFLVVHPKTNELESCGANLCHLSNTWPREQVVDAARQWMRNKKNVIESGELRAGG